jgi:hypothetical protein
MMADRSNCAGNLPLSATLIVLMAVLWVSRVAMSSVPVL